MPYTRPTSADDLWLNLPYRYWLDEWNQKLTLPGKALLLIALSLDDGFYLPLQKAQPWYGISRNTAQRGIADLIEHGLLDKAEEWVEAPLSDIGHRLVARYTLKQPFGPLSARKPKRSPTKSKPRATATKRSPKPPGRTEFPRRGIRRKGRPATH